MNSFQLIITVALMANAATGLIVYFTNTNRAANRFFFVLSLVLTLWFACLGAGSMALVPERIAFWIRQSSAAAALIPTAVAMLLLAIVHRDDPIHRTFYRARRWILGYLPVVLLCQTRFFLVEAHMPLPPRIVAVPEYGPGFLLYAAYFLMSFFLLATRFVRFLRTLTGMDRTELQFVLLGTCAGLGTGITALLLPILAGNTDAIQFLPLSALVLDGVLTYGMATQRVMDIPDVLRRVTAFTLLAAYLILLYFLVWTVSLRTFGLIMPRPDGLSRLLATAAIVISLVPANGLLQRFANRLFSRVEDLNVAATMQQADAILSSIGTLDALLEEFCLLVGKALGTDRVFVLLNDSRGYAQAYPRQAKTPIVLAADDVIVRVLRDHPEPLVPELSQRIQRSGDLTSAAQRLQAMSIAAAIGIYSKTGVEGLLLLGPRHSRRIYGAPEQETLNLLCRQLTVAMENARLYTQLQDSKMYHEILLDNLVSGVVAVDADGRITVINREAQRISRLHAADAIGHPLSVLPLPLARALENTLERHVGFRDHELTIHHAIGEETVVRLGSSVFRGHAGRILGALAVFHDMNAVRRLELQVRRTDRLASVGTLAAGMAHEIKNPLVTIKTFTQLLPERYDDADFRETFSSLLGQEVVRIDSIVNQLLHFSRPAKPKLEPSALHAILDASLGLMAQQIRQAGIEIDRRYEAEDDTIRADEHQLNQVFINLFLNALEAMKPGGRLTVATETLRPQPEIPGLWATPDSPAQIRVSVRDTGEGIALENIGRVFDPFFTTKTQGTGLGLSVAHGIVHEHGGMIDVESEPGRGTTFTITLPLIRKEAAV